MEPLLYSCTSHRCCYY